MRAQQTDTQKKAEQFSARVAQHFKNTGNWATAFHLAQGEDEAGAMAYRLAGVSAEVEPDPVISLSASSAVRAGETFDQAVARRRDEKQIGWREAALEVSRERPDLSSTR